METSERFWISKSSISDRKAKLQGYSKAASVLAASISIDPDYTPEDLALTIQRLQNLTGETWTEPEAWFNWWMEYGQKLPPRRTASPLGVSTRMKPGVTRMMLPRQSAFIDAARVACGALLLLAAGRDAAAQLDDTCVVSVL